MSKTPRTDKEEVLNDATQDWVSKRHANDIETEITDLKGKFYELVHKYEKLSHDYSSVRDRMLEAEATLEVNQRSFIQLRDDHHAAKRALQEATELGIQQRNQAYGLQIHLSEVQNRLEQANTAIAVLACRIAAAIK